MCRPKCVSHDWKWHGRVGIHSCKSNPVNGWITSTHGKYLNGWSTPFQIHATSSHCNKSKTCYHALPVWFCHLTGCVRMSSSSQRLNEPNVNFKLTKQVRPKCKIIKFVSKIRLFYFFESFQWWNWKKLNSASGENLYFFALTDCPSDSNFNRKFSSPLANLALGKQNTRVSLALELITGANPSFNPRFEPGSRMGGLCVATELSSPSGMTRMIGSVLFQRCP